MNVKDFPTMKPLDADKKPETAEAKPAETVPAAPAAEEKIDFSNVQIEPLFQDLWTSRRSPSPISAL